METAERWYEEAMTRIEAGESRAERVAAYKKTQDYKDDVAHVLTKLAADPDKVCEAIGPDGIRYPFSTNIIGVNVEQRINVRAEIDRWDKAFYGAIGAAILTKDAATIGELILRHAAPYLEEMAEEIVEEDFT